MALPLRLQYGSLVIDLDHYRVALEGRILTLSYREYAVLVYLATRAGRVVERRRLLEEGLARHDVGGLRMVDEVVRRLKSQLEQSGERWIEEVPHGGYRFLRREPAAASRASETVTWN